jgi:hypothetical protein
MHFAGGYRGSPIFSIFTEFPMPHNAVLRSGSSLSAYFALALGRINDTIGHDRLLLIDLTRSPWSQKHFAKMRSVEASALNCHLC